jgi:hypothetical protein
MKAKRVIMRSLACFMVACMAVLVLGGFTLNTNKEDELNLGCCNQREFFFEGIDCEQTMQLFIAEINGEYPMSTNNAFCFILGHSISTGMGKVIDHKFYASTPKCRETTYDVRYCTRSGCSYMTMTQLTQFRIHCCP